MLRTIHERFEHEMKASGKDGVTLEEYNQYLTAYIAQDYNRKVHASTGQTPEERFFAYPAKLRRFITKKEEVRSAILSGKSANTPEGPVHPGNFGVDAFLYLLMKLLKKKFTPSERLAVHALWRSVGPIDENLVRKTVGRLLGEEHPVEDLKGYLEEIRLCILTKYNTD